MPGETNSEVIQFENWTLRIRPSRAQPARLLLLIHGWTGDENSMWVFTHNLSDRYWMIAPRAHYPTHIVPERSAREPSGFSWRPLETSNFGRPSYDMFTGAAERLIKLVDAYGSELQLDVDQFDVMGFSQGAVMVNVLGMLHPQRVRKMAVLSGFVPEGMEKIIAARPLDGKQIFVSHGVQDETVAIERGRASSKLLEQAGAQVQYCEDEVGHKLSARCLRALEGYLED